MEHDGIDIGAHRIGRCKFRVKNVCLPPGTDPSSRVTVEISVFTELFPTTAFKIGGVKFLFITY
jgi:hypothetical protein